MSEIWILAIFKINTQICLSPCRLCNQFQTNTNDSGFNELVLAINILWLVVISTASYLSSVCNLLIGLLQPSYSYMYSEENGRSGGGGFSKASQTKARVLSNISCFDSLLVMVYLQKARAGILRKSVWTLEHCMQINLWLAAQIKLRKNAKKLWYMLQLPICRSISWIKRKKPLLLQHSVAYIFSAKFQSQT